MKEIFQKEFTLYVTGNTKNRILNNEERIPVVDEFLSLFEDGYEMPAFGVSLHHLTIKDMKERRYLIFEFKEPAKYEEYPFEALAVLAEPNSAGFNLLRRVHGKWDGRCLYWQTNKNMAALCAKLDKLEENV